MAATPQTLLALANCYTCYAGTPYMLRLMKLALLNQIATGVALATDPQSLLTQANCFECYAGNSFMLELFELALLSQIASGTGGGGGSGGGGVTAGNGAPTSTPTSSGALYIQQDSVPAGLIWEWYGSPGSWH
jgi:hypothetical protein